MPTLATPTSVNPSTIALQTVSSNAPTGNWRHPSFDEIHRRLRLTTFGERNIRTIAWNLASLVITFLVPQASKIHPLIVTFTRGLPSYTYYLVYLVRLLSLLGILSALSPMFRHKDDLSDIPLTPLQRTLLGLEPASRPATPGSQYITPPRYSRSATPRSDRSNSASPLSGKGSPFRADAAYSPSASPLFQKAVGRDSAKRLSFGGLGPSGLGSITADTTALSLGRTLSPSMGKGASVGLNNRWLYDRGRASLGGRSVYT